MFRILKSDLARIFTSRGFAAAVAVTAVLCFSVQVYLDSANGKAYSAAEALFALKRDFMAAHIDFAPPVIIKKALSGYSAMALPVTASFPFVLSFIAERNSGNMIFTITRASRKKYYLSKFITAILSGGLCTVLGVIIFGIFAYILFPTANLSELLAQYSQYFPNGTAESLVKTALSAFVYGAASSLPAFFLCAFCKNPYVILCFPFLLKFISEALLSKLQANGIAAGDLGIFEKTEPFFPNAASTLFNRPVDKTFYQIIAVNVIFAAVIFMGFVIIMEHRADRGR